MSSTQQTDQTVLELHIVSQFQCLAICLELLDRLLSRLRYQVSISVQDDLRISLISLSHFEENVNHFSIVDSQQSFVCSLLIATFITLADNSNCFRIAYLSQYWIIERRISRLSHAWLDSSQLVFLRKWENCTLHRLLYGRNLLTLFKQLSQTTEIFRFYHTSQSSISSFTDSSIRRRQQSKYLICGFFHATRRSNTQCRKLYIFFSTQSLQHACIHLTIESQQSLFGSFTMNAT